MKDKHKILHSLKEPLLITGVVLITVFILSVGAVYYQGYVGDYWRDSAPDGWYHQRSYVSSYDIINNGSEVFFPICDHSYLGPLHGCFKVASGVALSEGRFDFRVVNNVIVEAVPYGDVVK